MSFDAKSEINSLATTMYDAVLRDAPIYDYHTHLPVSQIVEDKPFSSISEAMLSHDHYKWRVMRYAGMPEKVISGDAPDEEKFRAWATVCEKLVGSPMKTWTELELNIFFGIEERLTSANAGEIFKECQKKIETNRIGPRYILQTMNVKLICTTDDPTDDLIYHIKLSQEHFEPKVLPSFRPDKVLKIISPDFVNYIRILERKTNVKIKGIEDLLLALEERLEYFIKVGCKLSDHSVEMLALTAPSIDTANRIFRHRLNDYNLTMQEASEYSTFLLKELGKLYAKHGLIMQLHVGALRNVNTRAFENFGPDTGFDVPNDFSVAHPMANLLDLINTSSETGIPKTIIYALNPKDYHTLAIIAQVFSKASTPGYVQLGPAWWFNDNRGGIRLHLEILANQGMLPSFIGMVTDSRSFLSIVRHTYFRSVLSEFLAEIAFQEGNIDKNLMQTLLEIASNIAWRNARLYILGS